MGCIEWCFYNFTTNGKYSSLLHINKLCLAPKLRKVLVRDWLNKCCWRLVLLQMTSLHQWLQGWSGWCPYNPLGIRFFLTEWNFKITCSINLRTAYSVHSDQTLATVSQCLGFIVRLEVRDYLSYPAPPPSLRIVHSRAEQLVRQLPLSDWVVVVLLLLLLRASTLDSHHEVCVQISHTHVV